MTRQPGLPEDGVTFEVICPAAPDGSGVHEVTLTSDWWLRTPHNLDAERVAVAFGSVCPCVDLVDRTLPAVRGYLTHRLRLEAASIVHASDGSWRPRVDVGGCCRDSGFPQARDAAAHLRRPRHWEQRFGSTSGAVAHVAQQLLDAVAADSGDPALADQGRDPACPPGWASMLWDAGLAPWHPAVDLGGKGSDGGHLGGDRHGIPLQGPPRSDPDTQHCAPTNDVRALIEAAYAASSGRASSVEERVGRGVRRRGRRRAGERADWLSAGVPPATVAALLADDTYSLEDARVLAARLSRPVAEGARVLAAWLASGLTPPVDTLVGVYWGPMVMDAPPPAGLVDETVALADRAGRPASRLDAACALLRVGTPSAAAAYLADPIRRADDPYSP